MEWNRRASEFIEDQSLFSAWKERAASEGLRVKIGRWKQANEAIAFLVDFTLSFTIGMKSSRACGLNLNLILSPDNGITSNLQCLVMQPGKVIESFTNSIFLSKIKLSRSFMNG